MIEVIIVDDEPMIREGLQTLIDWESHGFEVAAIAKDGRDALRKYEQIQPQLMIVDIRMPVMDGLQLIRKLREQDEHLHFIILSGYAEFEYARQAMSINVEGYLLKPVDEDELCIYLNQVKDKLHRKAVMSEDTVEWHTHMQVLLERIDHIAEPLTIDIKALSNKLYYALDIGEIDRVKEMVDQLAEKLIAHHASERAIKTYYVQYITMALNKITQRDPALQSLDKLYAAQMMKIYEQKTITQLQQYITDLLTLVITHIERESSDTVMKKMLDFIHRNYSESLKLDTCATLFNYNSAYLGQLFKSYTGEYFNKYLDKVRLDKAKELLLQDLKVYQISHLVGYSDVDYFHSKFKRYVGLTPLEYRDTMSEGSAHKRGDGFDD